MKKLLLLMLILMIVGCNRSSSSNSKHDDFILNWTLLDAVYFDDKPDAMREAFNNEAVNVTSLLPRQAIHLFVSDAFILNESKIE